MNQKIKVNRANFQTLAPEAMDILMSQELYLAEQFKNSQTLSINLWELIKLRISQINQCAYCIDMHTKEALHKGEQVERIFALSAWPDSPLFNEQEKLALDWAEHLSHNQMIHDTEYQTITTAFGEREILLLTLAINAINSWNRIVRVFQPAPGHYKVAANE